MSRSAIEPNVSAGVNRLIMKIRAAYPDRTKRIGFANYVKLTLIDFGWVIVIFLGYMVTQIHWYGPQVIFRSDLIVLSAIGFGMFANFLAIELLIGFLINLKLRLNARKRK